jgi:hypothetical protein
VLVGSPEQIDVARKIILALPGATPSQAGFGAGRYGMMGGSSGYGGGGGMGGGGGGRMGPEGPEEQQRAAEKEAFRKRYRYQRTVRQR